MAKIKILRNTVCGGAAVCIGDIVDASDADAQALCAMGKAGKVEAGEPSRAEPMTTEAAAPLVGKKKSKG